ncbi:hypothetical protein BC792_13032 [Sphingobacterium allocomposti]|uniref:Uncharacterized protein n=1 Tax=Sphingobacterium allocomposti TaxID=415956 RepID=A0A5S5CY86_9SPHI|nr:hypothetical protein BC792_13032 [Sphingobacterium composti Yoo et al. 2007 non Ten et al. 2007]
MNAVYLNSKKFKHPMDKSENRHKNNITFVYSKKICKNFSFRNRYYHNALCQKMFYI